MSKTDKRDVSRRWDRVANIAIIGAIAILLLNPFGMVGSRLVEAYAGWRSRQAVERVWDVLVDVESRLGAGKSDSGLIVEFVDYQCPSCRMVSGTIASAVATGEITVVVRHVPLIGLHAEARMAALAAICAERQGVFEPMHTTLMAAEDWMSEPDWPALGETAGVYDIDSFEACLTDTATLQRLEVDGRLADQLDVKGTPTFVTQHGLFEGARGFAQAIASIRHSVADGDSVRRMRVGGELVFDSRRHDNESVAHLGSVGRGFFVGDDRLAVVDGRSIHFIDYYGTEVRSVGGLGEGPGEFRFTPHVVRSGKGLAAWDRMSGRISWFTNDGGFVETKQVTIDAKEILTRTLVAAFADGDLLFRSDGILPDGPDGEFRQPIQYVEVSADGGSRRVAQAVGQEMILQAGRGLFGQVDVVFGHIALEAGLQELLAVAQTDESDIRIVNRNGDVVSRVVMPDELAVTEDQKRVALREAMSDEQQFSQLAGRALQRSPTLRSVVGDGGYSERAIPIKDSAPPIDRMLADADGRLWLRRYMLPGDRGSLWTAWDVSQRRPVLALALDERETLLDASGHFVLIHREDELGVDHIVVGRMEPSRE